MSDHLCGNAQVCPTTGDKTSVLRDMIFPQAEKARPLSMVIAVCTAWRLLCTTLSMCLTSALLWNAAWADDHLRANTSDRAQPSQSSEPTASHRKDFPLSIASVQHAHLPRRRWPLQMQLIMMRVATSTCACVDYMTGLATCKGS